MRGGAVILAAGFSRRFGSDKRWHELATGETLLISTLKLYLDNVDETAVILRKDDDQLAAHIQHTFKTYEGHEAPKLLFSPNSHLGMGHSIADALEQLQDWEYAMVALGDMPYIQPSTINSIEEELQTARVKNSPGIIRPCYQGQKPGHPVGFTCDLFAELKALKGDQGAKLIIERHASSLVLLDCDDKGILWDLDKNPE